MDSHGQNVGAASEVTKVTEAICSYYETILHTGAVPYG